MNYDYTIVESFVTFSVVRREVHKADGSTHFRWQVLFRLHATFPVDSLELV